MFTNDVLQEYLLIMRADEIEVEAKRGQVPTKPDPLKSEKEWFRFWEKLKNYLGRVRGAAKIPLDLLPTQAYGFGTHDSIVRTYTVQTGPRVLLWYTVFTILFPFRITLSLAVTCRTSPSHICMSMFSGANERL